MGFLYRPIPGLDRYPMVSEPSPAYPDVAGNHLLLLLRDGLTHSQYYTLCGRHHFPSGNTFQLASLSFQWPSVLSKT